MITVVITSYKYGHLVAHAVDSVLSQTVAPHRVLVVDDGVGDCGHIKDLYNVELIERPKNLGIVENFNDILFNHVDTERVMFLGADNWLRQDALYYMSQENADIVSSDMAVTGDDWRSSYAARAAVESCDGYPIWHFTQSKNIAFGNYIHGSSLYNAELAREVGGYIASSRGTHSEEDWMLWRRMLDAGASHAHISDYLLYYRRHTQNFNKV